MDTPASGSEINLDAATSRAMEIRALYEQLEKHLHGST